MEEKKNGFKNTLNRITGILSDESSARNPAINLNNNKPLREFCEKCLSETTDESPGSTFTMNWLFGTKLSGESHPCSNCGSIIQTKWFIFIIPILKLGKYRVIYLESGFFESRFIGRRLKD